MSNSLLTINQITNEAVRLWKNSNAFLQNIDRQYDDQFARDGAKIGTALRIRLPNDYTVRSGANLSLQDTAEQNTALTVATQKGVDVQFTTAERALSLDNYSERVLAPAINNLAGAVAADIISGSESINNFYGKFDGSNNVVSPDASTWLNAGALLDQMSCPKGDRKIILDPLTQARTVSSLAGLFNPAAGVSKQYNTGTMQQALGFDWLMDQTVPKHTTGAYSTLGTISGANQTGSTLTVSALAGPLKKGDIIQLAGSNSVNRITKTSNGTPAQFVVTADVAASATSIPIYPAIVVAPAAYATVDASPTNSGAITVVTKASQVYRKNFVYAPQAVTMATADLLLPKGVHEAARAMFDGISLRMITDYLPTTDQMITRLDILYGYTWVRPEWACVVPDAI